MLKYGIRCNGKYLKKWQWQCIEQINKSNLGRIELIIIDDNKLSGFDSVKKIIKIISLTTFLYHFYNNIIIHPRARTKIEFDREMDETPSINCNLIREGKFSQYYSKEDIESIKEYHLDFILNFGSGIIRGDILDSAKYGVWSFHHDDEMKYRGGPSCFWEIFHNDNVNGVILQKLTNELDAGLILRKGFFTTQFHSYSKNVDNVFFGSSSFPYEVCKEILSGNTELFNRKSSSTRAKIYRAPKIHQMIYFLLKLFINKLKLISYLFRFDKWNIGIINCPVANYIKDPLKYDVHWLKPMKKKGDFIADPVCIFHSQKYYLFYEKFEYDRNKGKLEVISFENPDCIRYDPEQDGETVLDLNNHLSYPYVFEYNDEMYLIPENYRSNEIALYKANKFPAKWEKCKTLIGDFPGIDSTIFQYNGLWWLFSLNSASGKEKLYIFYSEDLFGEWHPHQLNPVKTDVRSVRPGGVPFINDNILYRPVQDTRSAEYKLLITRICELSPITFKEEVVSEMPLYEPYRNSFHTLSCCGDIIVVDGKKWEYGIKFVKNKFRHYKRFI